MRSGSYRGLIAWQKGIDLAELIYRTTERFPLREQYGLSAQMRRSAVSIPSNLAEGHSQSSGAYRRHIVIALGSHAELSTQLELAVRLQLVQTDRDSALIELTREVGKITQGLLNALRP